ncbi:Abi family protein [Pseudaminobacter soli (ex Li et al. 2025)]|uniref:Abi family protein n=1 Tax=Pseudaminobacter soli (ex Li et al. 2025) TaxID=1295366 RepID=A0A2P7RTU9_9HYPH|nr:Abi family protein [Mesorhizobium soli]PSJ53653.1 abi family protein [Mesorhizobium soli]
MHYAKPYRAIDQQIGLIESRGMTVPDWDKAAEYLRRIGYYRLSAYWHPFRKRLTDAGGKHTIIDDFKPDADFKSVVDLYAFDKGLRLILLDGLERIEISLRTEVALAIGKHDPFGHRRPDLLDGRFVRPERPRQICHADWLESLDQKAVRSKEEFAVHFRTKYPDSQMPIWIAVELLDFGPLSMLLEGMKFKDQEGICSSYKIPRPHLLTTWIRSLAGVRNVCAHHARLWNKPLTNQPSLARSGELPDLDHLRTSPGSNGRLYAAACIVRYMLREISPRSKWHERLAAHMSTFPARPVISLEAAGFSDGWSSLSLWSGNT